MKTHLLFDQELCLLVLRFEYIYE